MEPHVLDLAQLARIQGTHRGFLYQHLYAAACLLAAPTTGVVKVRVERDEDLELVREEIVVYAQIKTRDAPLAPSDIDGVLERFDTIRAAHEWGERSIKARFALVANVRLGPTLAARTWPSDVLVVTPGSPPQALHGTGLIVPPPVISALLVETQRLAEGYRLSALRPDSLVAKLVGTIAHAAAGERPAHSFDTADLNRLAELVAAQIRPLPRVPRYLPQLDEPTLPEGRGSLVVLGHAGDGKSAWAAEVAAHASEVAVYVACSSAPGEQLAPRIVDAAVAALVARGNVRPYELVLPGRTGVDALALLDQEVASRGIRLMAVVDDCHQAPTTMLIEAMRAAPRVRWVLVGRSCDALSEVAALASLPRVELRGWNDDVIAALLYEAKCSTRPSDVAALRSATKGAPLFVLHAVHAISKTGMDTGEYARSLVDGTTTGRTAQEVLLDGAVQALDTPTARLASALASIDMGLHGDEWVALLAKAIDNESAVTRRALRALVERQIAHDTEGGIVIIHDAFRPLLDGKFLSKEETRKVKICAAELLRAELLNERASERIVAYVRILASLGKLSELADVANALSEWFRETGTIGEVRGHLEAAVREESLSIEDRFWALDTLAFFDIENELPEEAVARLSEMERLVGGLDDHARGALQHKKALVALLRGDIEEVRRLLSMPSPDATYARILRYHAALAEAKAGNIQGAVLQLFDIAAEYLAKVGLTQATMFAKNQEELRTLMRPDADRANVRHLADCYHAIVRITARHPEYRRASALPAVWSMKFYDLAGATRSVLRAGQDTVDMMLGLWDDPDAARAFMEQSLLPAIPRARLPEMTIPIRGQYAVVCAHCGDFAQAESVMTALAPYAEGLPPDGRAELENQRRLVAQLRARGPLPASALSARRRSIEAQLAATDRLRNALALGQATSSAPTLPPTSAKLGRNEPCRCGSGLKFKKCCGARS